MKRKTVLRGVCGILFLCLLAGAGLWYYVQTSAFMQTAGEQAGRLAASALGTEVAVGSVEISSLHELSLHDVAIYDKQAECIASAAEARVHFRLLSVLENPAAAVDEVTLRGVTALLAQRADGSWNIEDIETGRTGENAFRGEIAVEDARVTVRQGARSLTVDDVRGKADFAAFPAIRAELQAAQDGAQAEVTATLDSDRQIVNVKARDVDLASYLYLVPDGLLPDGVTLVGGEVKQASATFYRHAGQLSIIGDGEFAAGAVDVQGRQLREIQGFTHFTNRSLGGDVTAELDGEQARVYGEVRFDTSSPAMSLTLEAPSVNPAAVLGAALPIAYEGPVAVNAHIGGTFAQPTADGEVRIARGTVEGISFQNAAAHLRLLGGVLYLQGARVQAFGGQLSGEAELTLADMAFTGHAKAEGISLAALSPCLRPYLGDAQMPDVTGTLAADAGFSGQGADMAQLALDGSVSVSRGAYGSLPIDRLGASFSLRGRDLTLDYLSAHLPNGSSIGLEGTVTDGTALSLAFYGGHVDLSLLRDLVPQADITGLGDFKGTVQGSLGDPQVDLSFSAMHGKAFQQPFDTLALKAHGSLDGLTIEDFLMENGGKETWLVTGSIGLVGEKRLDLRVDSMGARMEDIAALVAPGEPITGNVDNTIHFTGTLDHPEAVGYIHFYRGSYRGVLLSGMDGDYFIKDDVLRLQVFHIYSPLVDAVLNGTIGLDGSLDLKAEVRDIDMKRIAHKLPYEVSGHGTFNGSVTGSIQDPVFDGTLDAENLVFNAVPIARAYGHARYADHVVKLDRFGFLQGDGSYDLDLSFDTQSRALAGNVIVENADVESLAALLNKKNDVLRGALNASAVLGGTADNPQVDFEGTVAKGEIAGYEVHDLALKLKLADRVFAIEECRGAQGASGVFTADGTVSLDGPIAARVQGSNIPLGMFTKAAGIRVDVLGTANVDVTLGDTLASPSARMTVQAENGGIQGSTFDNLTARLRLSHGILNVDEMQVSKTVGKQAPHTYRASASGVVPLRALTAGADDALADYEQIRLNVSLDDADLSLLPVLSPQVDWAMGATKGSVLVTGTAAQPLFSGSLSLADGAMKLKPLEKPIEKMKGTLTFHGNVMTMSDFSGKMGNGSYQGAGKVTLAGLTPTDYEASLSLDHLDVASDFYRGPLTGSLQLTEGELFGRKLPKLSGRLDFDKCEVSVPMLPDAEGELPEALLDFDVHAGDSVHFYSAALYDFYLTGDAHFGGTTRHPQPSGQFRVKRGGTVSYIKNVFKIREGLATFDQVDTFLPSIHFRADTKLGTTKITLGLDGTLDNHMKVLLTSSPEFSETEILRMLTLRNAYQHGGMDIGMADVFTIGLSMSVVADIEEQMRSLLWLDTFRISRGSGSALEQQHGESGKVDDDDVYNVEMGKRISNRMQVHYVRGVGSDTQRYGMQYDVNDFMGLTLDHESGHYIFGVEARYRF